MGLYSSLSIPNEISTGLYNKILKCVEITKINGNN